MRKTTMRIFSPLFHPLDDLQPMRVLVTFLIEYASLVEVIDANLARGVNDAFCVEHHAYMNDAAFLVAEKCQVTGLDFRQEIHQLAFVDLLGCVAGKEFACRTGTELYEAAAVDAEDAAAAPEIWSLK